LNDIIKWGITSGSHDGAIAVFENNKLVFATDSERFSRIKNDKEIPNNLFDFVKEKWGDPNQVFFYEHPELKAERRVFAGQDKKYTVKYPSISEIYDVNYTGHHHSHAAYGYYTSPFDDALVLVIDAIGEWDTLTLWKAYCESTFKDGTPKYKLSKIKKWTYPKSLGLMYSACTQAFGYKPNQEEYIMMGASALKPENKTVTNKLRDLWNKEFSFHKGVDLDCATDDIPASAQALYEEIFTEIITEVYNHPDYTGNLVLCGGCALNVKANRLLKMFDNVYIPCNPGDGGSAVGCVLARMQTKIDPTPYLGYEIEGDYPVDEIIKELLENSIVGVAKGKAEFGPRALGNRSIFGDPRVNDMKDRLNEIKGREAFRPFGAMILKEDVDDWYLDHGVNSPYMNSVFSARKKTVNQYPALVHNDHTSRLQVVDKEYHLRELLEKWKKETGCPMLINTSLNVKGQPLVNTMNDVNILKIKIL
jgi:carbamoyltransferase